MGPIQSLVSCAVSFCNHGGVAPVKMFPSVSSPYGATHFTTKYLGKERNKTKVTIVYQSIQHFGLGKTFLSDLVVTFLFNIVTTSEPRHERKQRHRSASQ